MFEYGCLNQDLQDGFSVVSACYSENKDGPFDKDFGVSVSYPGHPINPVYPGSDN